MANKILRQVLIIYAMIFTSDSGSITQFNTTKCIGLLVGRRISQSGVIADLSGGCLSVFIYLITEDNRVPLLFLGFCQT
jgi:uncharacterized protein (DUF488 family)